MKRKLLLLIFTFTLLSAVKDEKVGKFSQEELAGINELVPLAVKRSSWGRRLLRRYLLGCWGATLPEDDFVPRAVYSVDSPGGTNQLVESFHFGGEDEKK